MHLDEGIPVRFPQAFEVRSRQVEQVQVRLQYETLCSAGLLQVVKDPGGFLGRDRARESCFA